MENDSVSMLLSCRNEEFRLGEWLVQPSLNRLSHSNGEQRQLEPRLMHLLCLLAANPDRVLTRDQLVAEIWPRVVVNENSLTRAISELRKQLIVSGQENPVYIETIPKRGYRLLQEILQSSSPGSEKSRLRLGRAGLLNWQPQLLGSASFSFALLLMFAGWLGIAPQQDVQSTIFPAITLQDEVMYPSAPIFQDSLAVPTADMGELEKDSVESPVLSRDGSRYAYVRYDHMGSTIYLGSLEDMTEPKAVFFCDNILYNLSWSPVGNALLFASKPAMTTALYTDGATTATLMQLDLDSFKARRLVGEEPDSEAAEPGTINLT